MKGVPDAPQCGFSKRVVNVLQKYKVKFNHFNIFDDFVLKEQLKEYAEWPTYPQLWVKGELLGGCDVVEEMVEDGELEDELGEFIQK